MAIELIKVRSRRDHFHRDGQMVCERCMSKLASSGNPLYDAASEYFYVTGQLVRLVVETIHESLLWLIQHSLRSRLLSEIREFGYIANEILLIIAQFVLFVSMGVGMLVAAIFPSVAGGKSAYEEELDSRYRARKQREWEERQKDIESGRAYDEMQDRDFQSKRADNYARYDEDLEKFQKNRDKVNSATYNSPKILSAAESAEDDYLVKRANNRQKGVENGTEDIEDLRKDAEEVFNHRRETAAKDERRRDLLNRSKDKDWEAHNHRLAGDNLRKQGRHDEAIECYRRADAAQAEANGLYNEFLSV